MKHRELPWLRATIPNTCLLSNQTKEQILTPTFFPANVCLSVSAKNRNNDNFLYILKTWQFDKKFNSHFLGMFSKIIVVIICEHTWKRLFFHTFFPLQRQKYSFDLPVCDNSVSTGSKDPEPAAGLVWALLAKISPQGRPGRTRPTCSRKRMFGIFGVSLTSSGEAGSCTGRSRTVRQGPTWGTCFCVRF